MGGDRLLGRAFGALLHFGEHASGAAGGKLSGAGGRRSASGGRGPQEVPRHAHSLLRVFRLGVSADLLPECGRLLQGLASNQHAHAGKRPLFTH